MLALFWGSFRLVFSVKVIINLVDLGHSVCQRLRNAFPKGKVKTADLPVRVASEEVSGVIVAARHQRNPFFTFA
jgi:hypothetical protein